LPTRRLIFFERESSYQKTAESYSVQGKMNPVSPKNK